MSQPPSSDFSPETARVPRAGDAELLPSASGRHGRRRAVTVAALGCVAAGVMASAFASQAVPATSVTRAASPLVPATTHAASAFSADPSSSVPTGLTPNQIVNPLVAPAQPVVLSWTPVEGAVSDDVEVSSSPGFVYPVRPVWIQRDTSTGWVDYFRVPGTKSRFSVTLRATLATGMQHLRLNVPTDSAHALAAAASASRALFVYDVIVIKP